MAILQILGGLITVALLSNAALVPVVLTDPRLAPLEQFLESKGSPIPAVELLRYDNWRMVVALSCAESGYGKKLGGAYNAWGIKDYRAGSAKFGRTRDFESWGQSIAYTSELLYKYDPEDGEPSPQGMVRAWKYVRPYGHWINNVAYSLNDIQENVVVAA